MAKRRWKNRLSIVRITWANKSLKMIRNTKRAKEKCQKGKKQKYHYILAEEKGNWGKDGKK